VSPITDINKFSIVIFIICLLKAIRLKKQIIRKEVHLISYYSLQMSHFRIPMRYHYNYQSKDYKFI
jgi:hypothetical protein